MEPDLDLFRRGPDILAEAIAGVTEEESRFVAVPGKWTIRQLARHVTDTEIVLGVWFRQMIAEKRPLMGMWDQDAWAAGLDYNECDPFDSAAKFRILRDDMSAILDKLPAEAFERVGLHPARGAATLGEWVTRLGKHIEKHAGHIQRNREIWSQR